MHCDEARAKNDSRKSDGENRTLLSQGSSEAHLTLGCLGLGQGRLRQQQACAPKGYFYDYFLSHVCRSPPPCLLLCVRPEKLFRRVGVTAFWRKRRRAVSNPRTSLSFSGGDKSPRSTSRGRFAWKRRGLEKSKSLDQSEFLASLNGAASGGEAADPGWIDEDHRRESDSDEGERAILLREGIAAGRDSGLQTPVRCGGGAVVVTPLDPWWKRLEVRLLAGVSELIKDFSEVAEEELPDGDPEGDPLTVKKLKENILRFGCVMRPLTECLAVVTSLLHWESTSATLLALVVYLYSVHTIIGPVLPQGMDAAHVARRVQNQLGAVSNAAEKCKNLLLWEHEATRRLYALLWVFLLASILLPSSQIFTLIGVYLGIKFFVLDYVFYRYPRIRQKYDSTSRLWDTLPTDADLERRNDKRHLENGCSSPDSTSFLELFNLPSAESPLPGWQTGRRCTLVNRDRSLTSAFKNGRLYLTNSYLCFERSKSQSAKNLKLSLKDVRVDKANSYPWIPGGGMAIDVTVENSGKGYFFAGILNRDEVFEGIIEGCRRFGATWCDTVPAQDSKASKDSKDNKDGKEPKDSKDAKEQKENKDK
ncbi:putative GRAM domain-containing protein 4-like [Penaeus vannamei]|uniref:Putative GRAM domain-containing protein 4-like n=1 Tax=Penaeus vannamei TaxID=6689 RepID=A0A3R7MNL9_PENVA|nr:putative GRAM domain-containing protein 4-like [Penaeus vannamei]